MDCLACLGLSHLRISNDLEAGLPAVGGRPLLEPAQLVSWYTISPGSVLGGQPLQAAVGAKAKVVGVCHLRPCTVATYTLEKTPTTWYPYGLMGAICAVALGSWRGWHRRDALTACHGEFGCRHDTNGRR